MTTRVGIATCMALLTLLFPQESAAWDNTQSHRKITQNAINSLDIVNLDDFIRSALGINGLQSSYTNDGRRLDRVILDGSDFEDERTADLSTARGFNHFHDPTRSEGGLGGLHEGDWVGNSAVVWAEDHPNNAWDYQNFKYYFKEALISETEDARDQGLANMLRALGQVLHLIEDMAVPSHARNGLIGGHTSALSTAPPFVTSALEEHLRERPGLITSATTSEMVSFPRFRDYFDADVYTAESPYPVYGKYVGLTEYTNSFFVDRDTRFTTSLDYTDNPYDVFPHPALEEVHFWFEEKDGSVTYPWNATLSQLSFWKFYGGIMSADNRERVDHLVCGYYFLKYLIRPNKRWALYRDGTCLDEYLAKLVPKAVAYAASLAAYMTRGQLELSYDAGSKQLLIANVSPDDMEGLFSLYYDNQEGERVPLPLGPWNLSVGAGQAVEVPIPVVFPRDVGFERRLTLLFEGTLGEEKAAVAGVTKKLGPYNFLTQQRVFHASLEYPTPLERWASVWDDPYTLIREYDESLWFTYRLTDHTAYRWTEFFLMVEPTEDICKKLRLDCELSPYPISIRTDATSGDSDPGIVSLCVIETTPGRWLTLFSALDENPTPGDRLATPFAFREGIYEADPQFLADYLNVPSYTNRLSSIDRMCNPWETVGSLPLVDVKIRYHWDEVSLSWQPECPDAEVTFARARTYHPIYTSFFERTSEKVAPLQELLHNDEWQRYGFYLVLNRIEPTALNRSFVLYDKPVTFHKPYASSQVFVY